MKCSALLRKHKTIACKGKIKLSHIVYFVGHSYKVYYCQAHHEEYIKRTKRDKIIIKKLLS